MLLTPAPKRKILNKKYERISSQCKYHVKRRERKTNPPQNNKTKTQKNPKNKINTPNTHTHTLIRWKNPLK